MSKKLKKRLNRPTQRILKLNIAKVLLFSEHVWFFRCETLTLTLNQRNWIEAMYDMTWETLPGNMPSYSLTADLYSYTTVMSACTSVSCHLVQTENSGAERV